MPKEAYEDQDPAHTWLAAHPVSQEHKIPFADILLRAQNESGTDAEIPVVTKEWSVFESEWRDSTRS